MNALAVSAATLAGGAAGWLGGWGAVRLERIEGLEAEEAEERLAYEGRASGAEDPPAVEERWQADRYGWTWLERVLAPLLGAASFASFAARESAGLSLALHLVWMALFVHVVVFDLKHRLILNRITYPAIIAALALGSVTPGLGLGRALVGAVVVAGFFLVQSLVSRGRIGLGDAKLGALIGAITGLGLDGGQLRALYAVVYAVFLGGGVAVLLVATRLRGLKDPIPYGPFLCAGAALVLYQAPG